MLLLLLMLISLEGGMPHRFSQNLEILGIQKKWRATKKDITSTMERFELSRSKSNGLAIHRLNHSATLSFMSQKANYSFSIRYIMHATPMYSVLVSI